MKGQKHGYCGIIQDDKSLLWKVQCKFGRQRKVPTTIFTDKTKKEVAMSSDTLWRTFGGDMIRLNFLVTSPSENES